MTSTKFVEDAEAWVRAMDRSSEVGAAERIAELADELTLLESRGRTLAQELSDGDRADAEWRRELLDSLRALRRKASVVASVLESHMFYLHWSRNAASIAREYTPSGIVQTDRAAANEWEA